MKTRLEIRTAASEGSGAARLTTAFRVLPLLCASVLAAAANADEVTVWGADTEGQISGAPQPISQIAASNFSGFALHSDGSLSAWGPDSDGEVSDVPDGNCFTAIAATDRGGACALRDDGSIAAWGDDSYYTVSQSPTGSGYTAIAAGESSYACALRADGSIVAWGGWSGGPETPDLSGFTAIAVGDDIVYALTADGSIFAWNLATGSLLDTPTGPGFTAISAGGRVLAALDADGSIVVLERVGFGDNPLTFAAGDLSPPSGSGFTRIEVQKGLDIFGGRVVFALAGDGSIVAWGYSAIGFVSEAPSGPGFSDIAASGHAANAVGSDGLVVAWSLHHNFPDSSLIPFTVPFTAVAAHRGHAFALGLDGSIKAWGSDENSGLVSDAPTGSGFTAISTTNSTSTLTSGVALALTADGSIVAWGDDYWGQVSGRPSGSGFKMTSSGLSHSYAMDAAGSITAWGDDCCGQVSNTPTGSGFIAVAAGSQFGCALRADGSIVAWGSDFTGAVSGVPTGSGFTAIVADGGGYALAADGSITAWPVQASNNIPTGSGFTAIAVNDRVGYALTADGSIVAWGDDSAGQVSGAPAGSGFTAIAAGALNGYALSAARPRFVPGDRIWGGPDAIGEIMTVSFQGLEGAKLKLAFPKSNTAMKSQVTVRDDLGAVVKTWKIQHKKKKSKRRARLKRTGMHTLTIEPLSGTPGPFEIQTSQRLPSSAMPSTSKKKGKGSQKEVTFEMLALPKAKLECSFELSGYFSQMLFTAHGPDGAPLTVSTSLDNGILTVAPFQAPSWGAYRFTIKGFGTGKKGKVKATFNPRQPPPGSKTVFLP